VVASGRKLAGILSELRQGAQGAELTVGIGVNVSQQAEDFPPEIAGSATSLRLAGARACGREEIAARLLGSLDAVFGALRAGRWEEVTERFLRYAPGAVGRQVRTAGGSVGVTDGLDGSGALRIATPEGLVLAHASESVTPFTR
jgi:BirA family biotin operon repressor/biotin-[acetyl-CoA-carboxylase] ligase